MPPIDRSNQYQYICTKYNMYLIPGGIKEETGCIFKAFQVSNFVMSTSHHI